VQVVVASLRHCVEALEEGVGQRGVGHSVFSLRITRAARLMASRVCSARAIRVRRRKRFKQRGAGQTTGRRASMDGNTYRTAVNEEALVKLLYCKSLRTASIKVMRKSTGLDITLPCATSAQSLPSPAVTQTDRAAVRMQGR